MAALLMAANQVSFGQEKAGGELATDQFYLKLMSPNIQSRQGLGDYLTSPGNTWSNLNSYNNLYQIYLAKHEKEAFQVYYYERGTGHDIRLVIDDYTDANGTILPHTIYKEEFFTVANVSSDFFAEALVPYNGEAVHVDNGQNCVFYVELESAPDQPAGVYTSSFSLYEGEELLQSHEITALVWNFALPEAHYGTTFAGLYNSVSGYGTTKGFLEKSGVNFQGSNPASDADRIEAERILEGWQEVLLDHGVSTYELPRFMIDSDPKKAELAMADTRRKAFVVPSFSSAKIRQYKDIVYNNPFLADKSLFYFKDEPNWTEEGNQDDYIQTKQFAEYLESLWPGYHSVIPTYNGNSFAIQKLREMTDIFCPNQGLIAGNQNMYNTFTDGSWHRTWRYLTQDQHGCIAVVRWNKMHMGTMAKAVYWQQEALNSNGLLNWNIGFVPYVNGVPYDVWENHSIYSKIYPANLNGEGIFLYESASLGLDPANPIVSLRLKHMSNGMDDYDYLQLAKEAFGTDEGSPYMQAMNMVFRFYSSAGHQYIFSCEGSPWDGNHPYEWVAHDDSRFVNARILLGNALSEAMAGQHEYGEWQTVVLPDETHDGLDIRTCSHCGAQESRPKSYSSLYRFVGTENNQWAHLGNWANNPETQPSAGDAVVIASDCQINEDITVFHVVVNDGFNLTINNQATLASTRITTNGTGQVVILDGAQLITNSEGVQATVQKDIEAYGDSDGWYFIASPISANISPENVSSLLSNEYDLYRYNENPPLDANNNGLEWENYKNQAIQNEFKLVKGQGYLYANSQDATLEFVGAINPSTPNVSVNLDYSDGANLKGWNLVGNPYTFDAYIDKSYYKMNKEGTAIDPTAASASTAIPACTGIMVKAENTGESVTFSKTAPSAATNNGVLQIAVAQANTRGLSVQDKAIVSFNAGDELGKFYFGESNAKLYIPQNGKELAIATAAKTDELPLNFKATKNGEYTLSFDVANVIASEAKQSNLSEQFAYLHLIDNMNGSDVDLLQTPEYTFNAKTTDYASRFRLVFSAAGGSSTGSEATSFAFISNGNIVINGKGSLQVIDVMGRVVVCREASNASAISTNGIPAGVYILRLINGNDVMTQKIVIE